MNDALHMLIGAGLVVVGVLASALADRIRGLRVQRAMSREHFAVKGELAPAIPRPPKLPEVRDEIPTVKERAERGGVPEWHQAMGRDVTAALVASGYKKSVANEAVWKCGKEERATIESWTRAALAKAGQAS